MIVPDIHCQGCVETIKAGLLAEHGVCVVAGDAKEKTLRVLYEASTISPGDIETAVSRLGFRIDAVSPPPLTGGKDHREATDAP